MSGNNIHENLRTQLIDKILEGKSNDELIDICRINIDSLIEDEARRILKSWADSALVEAL